VTNTKLLSPWVSMVKDLLGDTGVCGSKDDTTNNDTDIDRDGSSFNT